MLLPEPKPDILPRYLSCGSPDISRRRVRPAKVHPDVRPQTAVQPPDVTPVQDPAADRLEQAFEVRAAEVGAAAELRQRVHRVAHAVDVNVRHRVRVQLLRQVRVDPEELGPAPRTGRRVGRLRLQRRQELLEPFKRARVLAHPDKLHPAQAAGRVRRSPEIVNVLENRRPWGHADAGADEHRDFVFKHVFRRRPVRAVDADLGHDLPLLIGNLVHAVGVESVVFLRLGRPRPERIAQRPGKITDLPNVDRDVRVKRARRDGEGVPLRAGDGWHVQEQPLPGLVRHARFLELNLERVVRVPNHRGNMSRTARRDRPVDPFHQIDPAGHQLPPPAFIADAVFPKGIPGERGEWVGGVSDEAAGGMGVEAQQEGDEKVMGVIESFK